MEMILISPNKLKIIMLSSDLEFYDITTDMLDYGNTETKRMLWDLLSRAKHSIGFDPDGHRVFVQLYPSKDGSCEMFVTKIGLSESSLYDAFSREPCSQKCNTEYKEKDCYDFQDEFDSTSDIENNEEALWRVFEMFSLDALCDACRRLAEIPHSGKSSVYIFNGCFYLLLFSDNAEFSFPIDELSFVNEYGDVKLSRELLLNIYEFGKLVCENNAVSVFSEI